MLFGVHYEVAEHYGVSPDAEKPPFLDARLPGRCCRWLTARHFCRRAGGVSRLLRKDSLYADTVGEIEVESKVLVVKRKIAWFPNHKT